MSPPLRGRNSSPRRQTAGKKYIAKNTKPSQPENKPVAPQKETVQASVSAKVFQNISRVERNGIDGSGFLSNKNFVTRWNILGPFAAENTASPNDLNGEAALLHQKLFDNEKGLSGNEKISGVKWQLARFESPQTPGKINLRRFFKASRKQLAAYAVTYLQCSEPLSGLTLYTGSSGYIKVWINHELVHTYDHNDREGKWDQDLIKNIKLRQGYNLIVVKCVSTSENWCFYFRLADVNNLPLKFTPCSGNLPKPGPRAEL